jgi:hypothetical protein
VVQVDSGDSGAKSEKTSPGIDVYSVTYTKKNYTGVRKFWTE